MNSLPLEDSALSDDEIYFGRLSLKEMKKHLQLDSQRKTLGSTELNDNIKQEDISMTIIKTSSEPNFVAKNEAPSTYQDIGSSSMCSHNFSDNFVHYNDGTSEDSFINIEKLVNDKCETDQRDHNKSHPDFDNTLEEIDYILNQGKKLNIFQENHIATEDQIADESSPTLLSLDNSTNKSFQDDIEENVYSTPTKTENINALQIPTICIDSENDNEFKTPLKVMIQEENSNINTPCTKSKIDMIFKTPANPSTAKKINKLTSIKRTPVKSNLYNHITSPIASYIKNSPQVPFFKDIRPNKPLPASSAIPKLIKAPTQAKHNKENVNLPSLAYKSAKETKVIHVPEFGQLPQNQWVKKLTSSLPRPTIVKHNHRENACNSRKVLSKQEDSFANLSLHQADVSVLTQKTAVLTPFNSKKY